MTKPLKIHFDMGDTKILCMRLAGSITTDKEKVTCCFCKNILKKEEEAIKITPSKRIPF